MVYLIQSEVAFVTLDTASRHDPARSDPVNEEIVVYQNPFLFLKVWEVVSLNPSTGMPAVWPWHYHKEVEFLAVTAGRVGIQTEDDYQLLEPGDLMLFGSSQLHRTRKALPNKLSFIVLQVDLMQYFDQGSLPYLHYFSELKQPLGKLNYIFRQSPEVRREAYALVSDIYREAQQQLRGYELAIGSAIKRLMWLLLRHDTRGLVQRLEEADAARLRPALEYIDAHLDEKLTVEQMCGLLNLSYHYFIRYFRQVMGMSFLEYVNFKRIKKAERLLLTRDLSITQVAYEAGIPNTAQFYKLFRRYNRYSPKQFQARMSDHTLATPEQAT